MTDISHIKTISVIGAGTMGHEIAQVALMGGFEKVILNDLSEKILVSAKEKIHSNLLKLEKKDKLDEKPVDLMNRLKIEVDLSESVQNSDFIIEAIPEDMDLKQELFRNLGLLSPSHAILATNTSTMNISKIAEFSNRKDKVIGMHFFTPIALLRLIEVIKGKKTSQETFEITTVIASKFPALKGKRYIAKIEKESPGFIVNRLTISSSLYLMWLLDHANEKGINCEMLDNDVAQPPTLGPYCKWDYLGLDVIYNSLKYFAEKLSPEFTPRGMLADLVKVGNLGVKTGKGLYNWDGKKPIRNTSRNANLLNFETYYAIQLNEGCRLLKEGIVKNYKIIDKTMLAGMDMPGPFGAGKRNYIKWTKTLENFSDVSGLKYLKPCQLMRSGEFLNYK